MKLSDLLPTLADRWLIIADDGEWKDGRQRVAVLSFPSQEARAQDARPYDLHLQVEDDRPKEKRIFGYFNPPEADKRKDG